MARCFDNLGVLWWKATPLLYYVFTRNTGCLSVSYTYTPLIQPVRDSKVNFTALNHNEVYERALKVQQEV